MIHELKTWPEVFEPVRRGNKTHEFRKNDRGFTAGDSLILKEYEPVNGRYTGREVKCRVTFVSFGGVFDIPPGYCVMSICTEDDAPENRSL